MRYAFIRTQARVHRVTRLCHALAVSRSGYYAWRYRGPSARAVEDADLTRLLRRLHQETREQYGAIKLWREAQARGIRCGRHRVARLRKLAGLEARRVRRFRLIVGIINGRRRRRTSCSNALWSRASIVSGWGMSRMSRREPAGSMWRSC